MVLTGLEELVFQQQFLLPNATFEQLHLDTIQTGVIIRDCQFP